MLRTFTLLLFFSFSLAACLNPLNILENDKPERAYKVSKRQIDRRLEQHKPLRERELLALRESYRWLQDIDIDQIEQLEQERRLDRWLTLYPTYLTMLERRQEIDQYLDWIPALKLRYDIATLAALTERSRLKAGNYCFEQAMVLVPDARSGYKPAAREAFAWLERSISYVPEIENYHKLHSEMYDLGTVRVSAFASIDAYDRYGYLVECTFSANNTAPFRSNWLEVHYWHTKLRIDYDLMLSVSSVYVSQNQESSSTQHFSEEVIDGYKTIEKQVTKSDTTYTVTEKVPIKITVYAEITDIQQSKTAYAGVDLMLIPINGQQEGQNWHVSPRVDWSNEYSVCSGDERALPRSCSGSCAMFPGDGSMICDLGGGARSIMLSKLCSYFPESHKERRRRSQIKSRISF